MRILICLLLIVSWIFIASFYRMSVCLIACVHHCIFWKKKRARSHVQDLVLASKAFPKNKIKSDMYISLVVLALDNYIPLFFYLFARLVLTISTEKHCFVSDIIFEMYKYIRCTRIILKNVLLKTIMNT